MKPAEKVLITRTEGDTDPLSVILKIREDSGVILVDDSLATTEMRVKDGATVAVLPGVGRANGTGTFDFDPSNIVGWRGVFPMEIFVNDGTYEYVIARGKIQAVADMA